jgi:hypothetical protein
MMGADGLKEKIDRAIEGKKVGYTEMLSRYGDTFSKVTPDDGKERAKFLKAQAAIVAKVNAPAGTGHHAACESVRRWFETSIYGNRET